MRILFVTGTYIPSVNGVALSVKLQKDLLEKRGHMVTVIAPTHPNQKAERDVIRFPSLPNPKYPDYPIFIPIPYKDSHLKVLNTKYDLVVFHHPYYIGEAAITMGKIMKYPSVFFHHTEYIGSAGAFTPKPISPSLIKGFVRKHIQEIASRTNHIIVETDSLKKKLIKLGIKTPITTIASGTNSMQSELSKTYLRKKYHLNKKDVVVLCVSRLSKEKNVISLIKIFSQIKNVPNLKLLLAGDGPLKNEILSQIKQLQINDKVVLLGNIDYSIISEIYSASDIFAYTSKIDTQAIVILEAMSAGLPILAFDTPGPKDFVKNNVNGYLVKNITDFTKQLAVLIKDKNITKRMGQESACIAKKYSTESSIKKLESLFKDVISSHN